MQRTQPRLVSGAGNTLDCRSTGPNSNYARVNVEVMITMQAMRQRPGGDLEVDLISQVSSGLEHYLSE